MQPIHAGATKPLAYRPILVGVVVGVIPDVSRNYQHLSARHEPAIGHFV